ncbi:MAG: hypothetical protein EOO05_09215 [Chitinophagaceae bacterium]|nr:MAG: hypothetical protein EOO05_09215 [Chitinophagaceae bacterium]
MRPVLSANQLPFRVWLIITVIALSSFRGIATPASITGHPASAATCPDGDVSFTVTASDALSYQWWVNTGSGFEILTNGGAYAGVGTSMLTITAATEDMNGYQFHCSVQGSTGPEDFSNDATLSVAALAITENITGLTCYGATNGSISLDVTGGNGTYTYWWLNSGNSASVETDLGAGDQMVIITDGVGCGTMATYTVTGPDQIIASESITNVTSSGGTNGAASLAVTGGSGSYGYLWSPGGQTTSSITGLAQGNYECTITDAYGCSVLKQVTVLETVSSLAATISKTDNLCAGALSGTAEVTATGGTAPYTYSWSSGQTTALIDELSAGTYTCTVTDALGAITTQSVTLVDPTPRSIIKSGTNVTCFGANDGTASVLVTGGTAPYSYVWVPGVTQYTATATNLAPGSYTCNVFDANGCGSTRTVIVTGPTQIVATTLQDNNTCAGGTSGMASVAASGGSGTYTYNWAPSGGTDAVASNLTAGIYTCTITDGTGCSITKTFTITEPAGMLVTPAFASPACPGGSDGSISLSVTGGSGPYTYYWTGSGNTTQLEEGLSAGTYECMITDSEGCSVTESLTVTDPIGVTATHTQTNATCFDTNDGTATVNPSGGAGGYTYFWFPGFYSTQTVTGLAPGIYNCLVSDANGCGTTVEVTITAPSQITATSTQVDNSCAGGNIGSATVVASGGSGSYTYLWSPSGGTAATASGLATGTYECTITDGNGCSIVQEIVILEGASITSSTTQSNVKCNGASDGEATVSAAGGVAPYSYLWSNGETTAAITGLSAGTYTCTITASNGCSTTASVTISEPAARSIVKSGTNVTCFGASDGTASVVVTGGTAPYNYIWMPGAQTTATATNLAPGSYTCNVYDANGCGSTRTVVITGPTQIVATSTQVNNTCSSGTAGSATVAASGGSGSYTYNWSPSGGTAATATGLAGGTYTCTITDGTGCFITKTFTITAPAAMAINPSITGVTCAGGSDGNIQLAISGGTAPYTYSWTASGNTTDNESALAAGTYECVITDANGCSVTQSFTVTEPAYVTATTSSTAQTCAAATDGTASVVASGGTPGYTYFWWPSGQTTATATGLAPGDYNCFIYDVNGCGTDVTVTVAAATPIAVTPSHVDATCASGTNGSATVNVTGGSGTYTYSWAPSGGTGATASGLAPGTYTCTVTDGNGCSATQTFTIALGGSLTATVSKTDVLCYGGSTGEATVTPAGGAAPYTYAWSSGGTAATETGLAAGTYTCIITSANGCSVTQSITISEPPAKVITKSGTNVTCFGANDGTASVVVTGGTAPYNYIWLPGGQTTATATGLAPGSYTCNVYDANGCGSTRTVTIGGPTQIVAVPSQVNVTCYGMATGSATVAVSGGSGSYTYSWSPSGGTAATATGLAAGNYSCTITDGSGCSVIQNFVITENTQITTTYTSSNVSCFGGSNGGAIVSASGGTGPYTYSWSPSGGTSASASGLVAGTYTCTITGAGGCTATQTVTITEPAAFTITRSGTNVTCFGASDGTATVNVSGGTAPYNYIWLPGGQTTSTATGLAPGIYTCTIYDANGCGSSRSVTIAGPAQLAATVSTTNNTCYGATDGEATVTVTGGTGAYSYSWSSGGSGATETGLAAGAYNVVITDANGCSITQPVTITEGTQMIATSAVVDNKCHGASEGTATVSVTGGVAPYTYSWSSGGTAATEDFLAAGTYDCTITGANGCSVVETVTIGEPAMLTAVKSGTNVSCFGAGDGTASVVVSGGTAPYYYNWNPGGQTTATATGLAPGSYTCTIYDANGCGFSRSVTISGPTQIIATTTQVNITCNGSATGSATVSATGGAGSYTYNWLPSGGTAATATGLAAGTYTVTVTDVSGCSVSKSVTLTEAPALVLTGTSINESCVGMNDGSATVSVTGGTGAYTYNWSPSGGTGATASGLAAGTYTVTVTDASGCSSARAFVITGKPLPSVNAVTSESICNNSTSGGFVFSGSAVIPTTYNWSNNDPSIGLGAYGTGDISPFTAVNAGTTPVTATVTVIPEADGCTGAAQTFTIVVKPTATVNPVSNITLCLGETSPATMFSGAVSGTSFTWTNNETGIGLAASGTGDLPSFTATNSTTSALTATITVTGEADGCAGTAQVFLVTVNLPSTEATSITSSKNELCGPGSVNLTVNGGTLGTGASWKWYSGSCGGTLVGTGATLTNVPVGATTTYFVRAEGDCGMTDCVSTTVTVNPQPVVTLTASGFLALQPGMNTKLTATPTPSSAGDVYTWYRNGNEVAGLTSNTYNVTIDTRGSYTVKVTSIHGCEAISNVVIIRDSLSTRLYTYPNPNNGIFKVRHYSPSAFYGKRHMTVYNAKGELVYKKEFVVNDAYTIMDVNIMGVAQGTYILVLGDAQNRVLAREKILVF